MNEELKPCPFCGNWCLVPGYDVAGKFVRCNECGATGPRVKFDGDLEDEKEIEAWNRRANDGD